MLSWEEIEEMVEGGVEIGSHTLDHPVLSRLTVAEAERQIVESRDRLAARLNRPIRFFSYPNGKREDVTSAVQELVRAAGYRGAVSTIEGRARASSDPFLLERVGATVGACTDASGQFSDALFAAELSGLLGLIFMRRRRGRSIY